MDGDRIGKGYLIYRDDGRMMTPTIFNDADESLPEGMYNFMPQGDGTLIILPKRENQ